MGTIFESIDNTMQEFLEQSPVFFIATAPSKDGHINISPKGLDTFRVIAPRTVAYLDLTGSGVETIAHLRDNGRITLMFVAFSGKPNIIRLYGKGEIITTDSAQYAELLMKFDTKLAKLPGIRSIIKVDLDLIYNSCGFGVPIMKFVGEHELLIDWMQRKSKQGETVFNEYHKTRNAKSIDGLPGFPT